jgi:hypothetical protein
MPSHSGAINFSKEAQDYEQSVAIAQLKANEAEYKQFLNSNKTQLANDIFTAKSSTFDKVLSDAKLASDNNNNLLYYYSRNKELLDTNDKLATNIVNEADKIQFNDGLAKRHFELNEWAVQDKRDTLFVYQTGFISLLAIILLTLLKKLNVLGGGLYWYLIVAIVVIFIFMLIYRIIYTKKVRDKFYWSRRKFGTMNAPPASGSAECPTAAQLLSGTLMHAGADVWGNVVSGVQSM